MGAHGSCTPCSACPASFSGQSPPNHYGVIPGGFFAGSFSGPRTFFSSWMGFTISCIVELWHHELSSAQIDEMISAGTWAQSSAPWKEEWLSLSGPGTAISWEICISSRLPASFVLAWCCIKQLATCNREAVKKLLQVPIPCCERNVKGSSVKICYL